MRENPCSYCGNIHATICPRIQEIEYHPDGRVKRVVFFPYLLNIPLQSSPNALPNEYPWQSPFFVISGASP